jgi:actin-related protein 8
MALPSACVIDIGSSKISISCIDEGLMLPKTLLRKHYGGDDIDEVFYRMLQRTKALHYFPKNLLNMESKFHRLLISQIKEKFAATEMDPGEIVKTIHLTIKDKIGDKKLKT